MAAIESGGDGCWLGELKGRMYGKKECQVGDGRAADSCSNCKGVNDIAGGGSL